MIKNKNDVINDFENENIEELEYISIEDIDKEMEDFYIDNDRIENIKYTFDKDSLIKDAIDKAEKEIKINKIKRNFARVASIVLVILSIGICNPSLAYFSPTLMKKLEEIHQALKIDEISEILHLNKKEPQEKVNETNEIELEQEVPENVEETEEENTQEEVVEEINMIEDEGQVVTFIHKMSNEIINADDGQKFGIVNITPINIELALNSVKNISNEAASSYLFQELSKWKEGYFENGVEVHNYVWNMLEGDIGKASSLDRESINNIKNNYFK